MSEEVSPWESGWIILRMSCKDGVVREVRVEADTLGAIAVHQGVGDVKGLWCIDHTRSGTRLCSVTTNEDARAISEVLNNRCGRALMKDSKDAVLDMMPMWAVEWIGKCQGARKFVKPPEA